LQQIHVLADWHGTGIVQASRACACATARGPGAGEPYLSVFDHNDRAKRFHARRGFEEIGRCTFVLGEHVDDARIRRLRRP